MKGTSLAAVVPAGLRHIRKDLDLELQHIAAQLGISTTALSRWEHGRDNPRTRHILAYAALLNRRLMAGRDRVGIYDLALLLPRLAAFRVHHNLSQQTIADRMHVTSSGVGNFERKAARGGDVGWDRTVHYLDAIGYQIGTAKITAEAIAC